MPSIFVIGAAMTNVFGRMVGNGSQGWAPLAAMGVLFVVGVTVTYWAEACGNPTSNAMGLSGGNMEGKEVRFGIVDPRCSPWLRRRIMRRGQRHGRLLYRRWAA